MDAADVVASVTVGWRLAAVADAPGVVVAAVESITPDDGPSSDAVDPDFMREAGSVVAFADSLACAPSFDVAMTCHAEDILAVLGVVSEGVPLLGPWQVLDALMLPENAGALARLERWTEAADPAGGGPDWVVAAR